MKFIEGLWFFLLLLMIPDISFSQEYSSSDTYGEEQKGVQTGGFIRAGLYTGFDRQDNNKPYISSAFADLCLKVDIDNEMIFKSFADIRFRYGVEFLEPVKQLDIHEAYIKINGKHWDLTAGQKIVKWGRADFTNPTSKINPRNLISRSPDREDMDMGNLLTSFKWHPSTFFNIEAVITPFYRSSVLLIDPVPLPENVTINQPDFLTAGKEMFSYGLKADFHLPVSDWSISWFNGYDPMPGTALTSFDLDESGQIPVPVTDLSITPYKTRVFGIDFETTAGQFGIRGEAAWSVPQLSYEKFEYVPSEEINWVAGIDWRSGIWHIMAEYSGKTLPGFKPANANPVIGAEVDYTELARLIAIPDFNLEEYVRQQVSAFNRLYNYQLKRNYHSAGLRIESDLSFGRLTPSIFTIYNFSYRDLLLIPEIRYKPVDGLSVTAGGEIYSGRSGSLFDIVDDFMNCIYISLRVDF